MSKANTTDHVIGKCGICGGLVTVPKPFHSIVPPVPRCESCGAYEDQAAHLPTIPMKRGQRPGRVHDIGRYRLRCGRYC